MSTPPITISRLEQAEHALGLRGRSLMLGFGFIGVPFKILFGALFVFFGASGLVFGIGSWSLFHDCGMLVAGLALACWDMGDFLYRWRKTPFTLLLRVSACPAFFLLITVIVAANFYSLGTTFGFLVALLAAIYLLIFFGVFLWRYRYARGDVRQG